MFNTRGGFPGQRPMGPPRMNQPGLNHLGMNMSGMNMSGMNMSGMGMSNMNQPNMNTGMNQMGHPGMKPNVGLSNTNQSGMNQPGINVNRMGPSGMNQGGMNFHSEIKNQGFGMRPMDSSGPYHGGSSEQMGMKGMPLRTSERHMGSQNLPQRFSSPSGPINTPQPRMHMQNQELPIVNRAGTHSSDHLRGNPKSSLQEPAHLMAKKSLNSLNMFRNLNQDMGIKPGPSSLDPMSNAQNRYTNESASSILESFGLSNEDLEELSRYPDDQLTPTNLPNILRDIRLRKINRTGSAHDQGAGGRRPGGEGLPSKVIDYGHSSKFQFNDNSAPSRPFDSSRTEHKPSSASKEPTPSSTKKNEIDNLGMDNKIPIISSSRKSSWQVSKPNRSNNKTLIGEPLKANDDNGIVMNTESSMVAIQPDSAPLCDIPVNADAAPTASLDMNAQSPIATVVSQVNYPPPAEVTAPSGKGNWVPPLSQVETQKLKRMPTPSMMNDYFAASPRIFPHICSLCNVECRHLKDWIKHQNNTSHIDNCRKLRQQYPDWNPQVHSVNRDEGKKNETSPKRSLSKSTSPRRTRRSGSRHRAWGSRSRSPRSGRRSRSRSPRRSRHSPRRSRSPRKNTRSPRRSPSPRRHRRGRSSTPPDKRAVDAAVQSFIEASKLKSGEKAKPAKSSTDVKKLPPSSSSNSNVKGKKPAGHSTPPKNSRSAAKTSSSSSHSDSSKKPASNSSVKSGGSGPHPRKPLSSNASKKPVPKPVSKTVKPPTSVPAKKPVESKAPVKPKVTLNKLTSKCASDKIVHITNLPDSGYTDQDILKIVQPFGKVFDILIVRSKNEAFLETNFKEAAAAAVKFSETVPVIINGKRVVVSVAGKYKGQETVSTSEPHSEKPAPPKAESAKENKEVKEQKEESVQKVETAITDQTKGDVTKQNLDVPPGFIKCYRLVNPPLKDAEKCVIVISNLPDKKFTVEEVSNLARPFGGVNDILVIANHQKAYLELPSKNSVDSMIKFYNVFPTSLHGNALTIAMAPKYKDLKDENRIFTEIIEQTSFKITPTIYEKFVHLSDLPDREIEEFELTRIGLRFGKVEHYMVISNKRKAIFHMNSLGAAKCMHTFLSRFPGRVGESILKCSLSAKTKLAEDEYITYMEENISSKPDLYEDTQQPLSTVAKAAGVFSNVEVEDDDDDEEAAEAPEASEAPSIFIQPEPVVEQPEYIAIPQVYSMEESEVLVSVESDEEEECDVLCPDMPNEIPVIDSVSMEHLLTAEDSEESDNDMETTVNEKLDECPKPLDSASAVDDQNSSTKEMKPEDVVNRDDATNEELTVKASAELGVDGSQAADTATQPINKESDGSSVAISPLTKLETSPSRTEESSDKETKSESGHSPQDGKSKRSEETSNTTEEKSKPRKERSKQSSRGKNIEEPSGEANKESKDAEQAAVNAASLTRTAKYNPQRGELSVTLMVDNQKSTSRTPDTRKRSSGDRGSSGRESSTPKSSSNRSSPSESTSSNVRSSTGSYQTKGSYRGANTQDKDTKVTSRSRENDFRSNKKDDRSKDSPVCFEPVGDDIGASYQSSGDTPSFKKNSSSRFTRSSTRSTRAQREEEEGDDLFPFNLDEFVTVDEIVEEQTEPQKPEHVAEKKSEATGATRKGGKRKENHPADSDGKKPKEASDTQELSFVTLDEVGDEEDNTTAPESVVDQEAPAPPAEEAFVEAVQPLSTQESSVLMTLDEVSDDEEPNVSTAPSSSSAIHDKDQLLTLDEVSGEDEDQTSHSEPFDPDKWLNKEIHIREDIASAAPETKESPEVPDVHPQELEQHGHGEQPLLTLDEVKADDEEEDDSLGDMEHQFLTVDEVGGEDEDLESKEEEVEKTQTRSTSKSGQGKRKSTPKSSQAANKTPAGRRGRPRKRPLSETPDVSKEMSADSNVAESGETPTKSKPKASKDTDQTRVEDGTITSPDVPGSTTPNTSETPAKKLKPESPSGKTPLGPFNSSLPVGIEFLIPKTGYFCELCALFYMDDASKMKHCKSLRHYLALQKHLAKEEETAEGKSSST